MTLQEAIEWVVRCHNGNAYRDHEFMAKNPNQDRATAIATILNAVVKGELK